MHISEPVNLEEKAKSPQSLTLAEVRERLQQPIENEEDRRTLQTEYHKRWAISVLCVVFAMIGVGLGTTTNRRAAKAGGMILCIGLIIFYWVLYIAAEGAARGGAVPVAVAIWAPNVIFACLGLDSLRRNWN
ncbi:putative permease YjgP/YjgQ family protein [compost metagenome]